MKSHMPLLRIDVAAPRSSAEPSVHERAPRVPPGRGAAVTRVESEDLARFEGEGGLEAPELDAPNPEEWRGQ
jgi:hypothetical protein